MNTMLVQTKPDMMTHIPHHQLKVVGGPGSMACSPGMVATTGMVGLNGENHVKRPMNAFMVSVIKTFVSRDFSLNGYPLNN